MKSTLLTNLPDRVSSSPIRREEATASSRPSGDRATREDLLMLVLGGSAPKALATADWSNLLSNTASAARKMRITPSRSMTATAEPSRANWRLLCKQGKTGLARHDQLSAKEWVMPVAMSTR